MTITTIDPPTLSSVWGDVWPLLERAVKRSPDEDAPCVLALLRAGTAQLWTIHENGKGRVIAAIVTRITLFPVKRCLVWLVGGSRLKAWAPVFVATLEPWARRWGCTAIWGAGRPGWSRIVCRFGGETIEPIDGQVAWQRRIL
jgi:hypothetical protein